MQMTQDTTHQKRRHLLGAVYLAAMVLLSGCSEGKDSVDATASSKAAKPGMLATTSGPTAEHLGLTPAYLEGDWCNTHIQFPTTRAKENRRYLFAADGSFAAQTAPTSEMKPGLVYRYRPEGKIGMDSLLYQVKSVQPDEFVLHISANDVHFRRGTCQ